MQRCPACDGFVPPTCAACPHCDPTQAQTDDPGQRARAWQRLVMLLRITGGTAVAMTLMACYGAPPGPRTIGPEEEIDPKADEKDGKDPKAKVDPKAETKEEVKADSKPPTGQAPPE